MKRSFYIHFLFLLAGCRDTPSILMSDWAEDDEGNSHTIDLPKKEDGTADLPATVQDKDGKVYNVDENGNITPANDNK
ncbi:MAG: hypothetical protein LBH38_01755, partial [Holosporales bacterium]|nr:hypothetical protein [Holosporales bacterium]